MTRDHRRARKQKAVNINHKTEKKPKPIRKDFFTRSKKPEILDTSKPRKVKSYARSQNLAAVIEAILSPTSKEDEQLVLIKHHKSYDEPFLVQKGNRDTILTDPKFYAGPKNSLTEIHTHPKGSPPSDADFWTLLTQPAVRGSEVLTPQDTVFILQKTSKTPNAANITKDEFDTSWNESIAEGKSIYDEMKQNGEEMPLGANGDKDRAIYILIDQKMAEKYGLTWQVARKDDFLVAE